MGGGGRKAGGGRVWDMSNIDLSYCENMEIAGNNSVFFTENPEKTGLLGYKSGKMRNVGNRLRKAGGDVGNGLTTAHRLRVSFCRPATLAYATGSVLPARHPRLRYGFRYGFRFAGALSGLDGFLGFWDFACFWAWRGG